MHEKTLQKTNLTPAQAQIMDYLFQTGEARASDIAKKTGKSRAIVYKDLEELGGLGLVRKKEKTNQVATFQAEHPSALNKLIEQREKDLVQDKQELENTLPDLVSAYNLAHSRPGVRFYEGDEGIKKVLEDTLMSHTEIYTVSDSSSIQGRLKEINNNYVRARKRKGIKKRLIVPESARPRFSQTSDDYTEVRFLKEDYYDFKTGMQIYDNKISYQTLGEENKIGVIIEDKNIYKMHKLLFEYIWSTLK